MYPRRTEKIMSLVPVHGKSGSSNLRKFQNSMCNAPLSPVRKIHIISDIIINRDEATVNKCESNTSSSPPSGDFPDIEISSASDVAENHDRNDSPLFKNKEFSPFDDSDADPSYSPSLERKKKKRRFRSLLSDSSSSSKRTSSDDSHNISSNTSYNRPSISFRNHDYVKNNRNLQLPSTSTLDESKSLLNINRNIEDNGLPHETYINGNVSKDITTPFENNSKLLIPDNLPEPVESLRTDKESTKKRKPDCCYFCELDVLNFARHIQRKHAEKVEVAEIMSLQPQSKERKHLISKLRKKGNYIRNMQSYFKPVRSPLLKNRNVLPCSSCLGFYSSKLLYRHRKKCSGNNTRISAQADGQNILIDDINKRVDPQLKEQVFPRMRPDKISLEAKSDVLICAFGARYLKTHREKHFIQVTSRKMRELSRLLLVLKEKQSDIGNLFQALQPKYFELIVEATKTVAQYDESNDVYNAPTYAMNIATSLKQCCEIALTLYLTKKVPSVATAETEVNIKNMIQLLNTNWRFVISSQAGNDLNTKKWNKITIVPLADDLRKLKQHLIEKAKTAADIIKINPLDKVAFTTLLETIYCRVILLNRKRPGELQRIAVHTYLNCGREKNNKYEEFDPIISPTEKLLLQSFKRVVIRGKRGRGVAVLFSADVQEHINILLSVRSKLVSNSNPYLFGKPGLLTPITGYKVLDKYARSSGARNSSSITCTKLRKHLATLSQLFSLKETEIDQLATFMGHTIGVHKNSYRLPDDVHQTAKISKLLLLLEGGDLSKYKGKTLDEIDVDLDEDLLENIRNDETDSEGEQTQNSLEYEINFNNQNEGEQGESSTHKSESTNDISLKRRKKRILVQWTDEQKKVVNEYFATHIKDKRPPKRNECDNLKNQHPHLLQNKDWTKIKVFIQNIYSKKQKK